MKIRKATANDAKEISAMYWQLYSDVTGKRKKKRKKITTEFKSQDLLFVAEKAKKTIGFIWANFVEYADQRYGYINELFVKKAFRGSGVGKYLVEAVLNKMKKLKVKIIFVTTDKENKEAQKFYLNQGFKPCKDPWFYWKPCK